MITESDSGMTRVSNSGINASKIGLPSAVNADGVVSGVRKILVVEPIKYAIPPINNAKHVDAIMPNLTVCLSFTA